MEKRVSKKTMEKIRGKTNCGKQMSIKKETGRKEKTVQIKDCGKECGKEYIEKFCEEKSERESGKRECGKNSKKSLEKLWRARVKKSVE